MSSGKIFHLPGRARRGLDPYRMAAHFPDLWAGYLAAHYRRAEDVAVVFDVTYRTACNWLSGVSRPTGDKVMLEAMEHPERLIAHMRRATGEAA